MYLPIPGIVQDVPVIEILRNLVGSCDHYDYTEPDGWAKMIKMKARDSSFWELCEVIPERGFTTPICINLDADGLWHSGNGHHRLAAAIMLCLDSIPVLFADDDDYMHSGTTDPGEYGEQVGGTYVPYAAAKAAADAFF